MRIEDNPDLVKILKDGEKKEKMSKKKASQVSDRNIEAGKKEKWRADSEAFREAMKAGKQVQKAIATGGPLPEFKPSAPDPSMIPCPHCGRTFNAKAGERHIPQCQNIRAKPSSLKKGSGGAGGLTGGPSFNQASSTRGRF